MISVNVYAEIDPNKMREQIIEKQAKLEKEKREKLDKDAVTKQTLANQKEDDDIRKGKMPKVAAVETVDENSKKVQKRKFLDNTDFEQEFLNMKAQNAQLTQKLQQMQKQIDDLQSIVNKLKSLLK